MERSNWFGVIRAAILVLALAALLQTFPSTAEAACDVSFDGATLKINCDNASDSINVDGSDDQHLMVNETDLGSAANLTDVKIRTGDGNDNVYIVNLSNLDSVGNDLDINTAGGNDRVELSSIAVGNDLKVKTGDGNNNVEVSNVSVGNDLNISTGDGVDYVDFQTVVVTGNAGVKTGGDDDTISVYLPLGFSAYDIRIKGGAGSDTLYYPGNLYEENLLEIKNVEEIINA